MSQDQGKKSGRSLSMSTSSISIAVIVMAIVAIINFLGAHHPKEMDFTQNKIHTLSDQTTKVLNGLKGELMAEFYGEFAAKERIKPLVENYGKLSSKFQFEHVDPYKEPVRTKAAGVKKPGTMVLTYSGRSIKVEDITEEKITNSIIKIERENRSTVCALTGHGESSVEDVTQNGMQALKRALEDQAYDVKELSLPQLSSIPTNCGAIIMMGVHGSFFPKEIKVLSSYLDGGGRALIAMDAVVKNEPDSKEFFELLRSWGVVVKNGLIVDPEARKLGVDASLVLISKYNPNHPVTKEAKQPSYFPFSRPLEFTPTVPTGFKTMDLAKSNDDAWSEMDIQSFIKGSAQFNFSTDLKGPLSVAVVTSGKREDSKAANDTRVVVFGSSQFVGNQYSRFAGNLDFFMNAMSWAMDDESLISIRAKDETQGRVELPDFDGMMIFWMLIVIVPFAISLFGILLWLQRKKL